MPITSDPQLELLTNRCLPHIAIANGSVLAESESIHFDGETQNVKLRKSLVLFLLKGSPLISFRMTPISLTFLYILRPK